jgi:hypothetical protein
MKFLKNTDSETGHQALWSQGCTMAGYAAMAKLPPTQKKPKTFNYKTTDLDSIINKRQLEFCILKFYNASYTTQRQII